MKHAAFIILLWLIVFTAQVNAQETNDLPLYDIILVQTTSKDTINGVLFETRDSSIVVMIEDYALPLSDDSRHTYLTLSYSKLKTIGLADNRTKKKLPEIRINGKWDEFEKNKELLQEKSLMNNVKN